MNMLACNFIDMDPFLNVENDEETDNLKLREYQKELAEPALQGKNCIIVAPTGSGKTRVATKICQEHIKNHDHPKIIFLVPTVPLVNQQHKALKRYLDTDDENVVNWLSGETSQQVPVKQVLLESIVTVMTPQILKNRLNSYDNKTDIAELLDIQDLSLIIFDECHHAVLKHPYNQIMGVYFDEKEGPEKLPQIVGLTASPGIGKGEEPEKALESIIILMANLDVTINPITVRENIAELEKFGSKMREDDVISVNKPENDGFSPRILKIMRTIESWVAEEYKAYNTQLVFPQQETQNYLQYIVELHKKSAVLPDNEVSRRLINFLYQLRIYHNALEINHHVRAKDAVEYLNEYLFENEALHDIKFKLGKLYGDQMNDYEPDHENPMLIELEKEILKQYCFLPNSKCIVFARTRAIAAGLVSFLRENRKLECLKLNSIYLTGTNAKRDDHGLTPFLQNVVVQSFNKDCKLIVATSVAEEGLDIPTCNLIITYNYSTSEIGSVQRTGRARAEKIKIVILAHSDSHFISLEKKNRLNAQLTEKTLKEMNRIYPAEIKRMVLAKQKMFEGERMLEKLIIKDDERESASDTAWLLMCKECRAPVIRSNKLALLNKNHYIAADYNFPDKAKYKDYETPRQIKEDEFQLGKIYCKAPDCLKDWGVRMKYKTCFLSVIKISSFVMQKWDEKTQKMMMEVAKKWKKAPFKVTKDITFAEIANLHGYYTC